MRAVLLGSILALTHAAAAVVIFAAYFSSHDPQAALLFIYLLPLDPWVLLLSDAVRNEQLFALLTIVLGSIQWLVLGWSLMKAVRWWQRRRQLLQTPESE